MPTPLILGSSSRYRATALRTLGLEFQQLSPDVDESPRKGEQPDALALRLAQDKARYLAQRHPGAVVIGSDQVGSCEQRLLTKPGTQANAIRSLQQCSGQLATFHTALALARSAPDGKIEITGDISVTELKFRTLRIPSVRFSLDMLARWCLVRGEITSICHSRTHIAHLLASLSLSLHQPHCLLHLG